MPTFTELSLNGVDLLPHGINNQGEIVGTYLPIPGGFEQGFTDLRGVVNTFNPVNDQYAWSLAVSNSGNITGWGSTNSGLFAYSYINGHLQKFSFPVAGTILPTGINDRGQIVGTYYTPGDPEHSVAHGFLYANGTLTTIDGPNGTYADAIGINNAGQIVGGYFLSDGHEHGFLYDRGRFTSIDAPGAIYTVATSINNRGDIVGYYLDGNFHYHGYVDRNGTITTIDDPNGDYATWPEGINDRGSIVGIYVSTQTGDHGFLFA